MTSHSAFPERFAMRARGFTLTELAIVVVIVGFLIGGLLVPLATQMDVRRVAETQKTLELARDALLGFAAANGRLPCPARPPTSPPNPPVPTGEEWPSDGSGACTYPYDGFLPAVTLGITPTNAQGYAIDAWGNPIRYAVPNVPINAVPNPFTTKDGMRTATMWIISNSSSTNPPWTPSTSFINVCSKSPAVMPPVPIQCDSLTGLATRVPALIFSLGKNWATPPTGIDEQVNLKLLPFGPGTYQQIFVTHEPTPSGVVNGEFDDIVLYVSLNQLFNRMIMGGALP
jgi:prepilin-type N-terminal cleavage/methylation domain-containing protein